MTKMKKTSRRRRGGGMGHGFSKFIRQNLAKYKRYAKSKK